MLSSALVLAAAFIGADTEPCDPDDAGACFGNGICMRTAQMPMCACAAGWRGAACDVLGLGIVDVTQLGYRNASDPTWGGTVIQHGGAWHLFTAGKKPTDGPVIGSTTTRAVRAVSITGPSGPYRFAQVLGSTPPGRLGAGGIGLRVDVHRTPNGSLAMFTVGSLDNKWGLVALVSPVGDPAGPWLPSMLYRIRLNASARWDCGQLNDATASIGADGALLVAYRTQFNCAGQPLERVGLLHSPHWATGPLTKLTTDATAPLFGNLNSNEDPYLWRSARGVHMLLHTQAGANGKGWPDRKTRGAVAFAPGDGTNISAWRVSLNPAWTANVSWSNGSSTGAMRRQRPALIVGEGGSATHLITGVNFAAADFHSTNADWTLVTPLSAAFPAVE